MTTPDFVLELRRHVGHAPLWWMPGCTAVVVREGDGSTPHLPNDVRRRPHGFSDPQILVARRTDNGQWTPVTGIVDPGEEPAVAAAREVKEEAGIIAHARRLLSVEVVGPTTYENGDVSTFLDVAFLMEWDSGEPYPADGENSETRFVPVSDLPEMNERFMRVIERALSDNIDATFVS